GRTGGAGRDPRARPPGARGRRVGDDLPGGHARAGGGARPLQARGHPRAPRGGAGHAGGARRHRRLLAPPAAQLLPRPVGRARARAYRPPQRAARGGGSSRAARARARRHRRSPRSLAGRGTRAGPRRPLGMPELPDVAVYLESLAPRIVGERLERVRLASPFVLRTVDPPLPEVFGARVVALRRLGQRIVTEFEAERFLVIHLMIAGRLRWRPAGTKVPGKLGLAAFDFSSGTLLLTEASTRKRAAIHLVRGEAALAALDPGGLEPLDADLASFRAAVLRERPTLKRTLTDPRILSGIGNAYSDEILHRARLSPVKLTHQLSDDEMARLHAATRSTLLDFTARIRSEVGSG